ncbi:MAG: hypothetical protein JO194_04300 [Candidatus Eremiobacteraeota bacterium]|nr:hypothetical protein [Candidatus Eremiobacteraeota bacterium]
MRIDLIAGAIVAVAVLSGPPSLVAQPPIRVPKAPGSFDYMLVDVPAHRLLVAHTGSRAFAVLDLKSSAIDAQVYLDGAPHGIAVDLKRDVYFVGTSLVPEIAVISRRTLRVLRTIRMPGPVDALAFDSAHERLFADEDNGQSIWVLDARDRIVATLATPQDSDKSEFDAAAGRLYQNFTTINSTYVIDAATLNVTARWSTRPALKPHGIALDAMRKRIYVAGTNGWLVALSAATGRVVERAAIAKDVDQIAFDAQRGRVYCASGDGVLSVVDVRESGLTHVDDLAVPKGAHTLALDPQTGDVWISYGTDRDDYVMRLAP